MDLRLIPTMEHASLFRGEEMKNRNRLKEFLSFHKETTSFRLPIIKLVLFSVCFILLLFRPTLQVPIGKAFVSIVSVALFSFSVVFLLYIPIAEINEIISSQKRDTMSSERIKLSIILSLIHENDILEIEIVHKNKYHIVGSSSSIDNGSSIFYDKRFFIDKIEYTSWDDFRSHLMCFVNDGFLLVRSIDGVSPPCKWLNN